MSTVVIYKLCHEKTCCLSMLRSERVYQSILINGRLSAGKIMPSF